MKKVGRVVLEALLVTAAGVALAFAANPKSSRGLELSKNYFEVKPAVVSSGSQPPRIATGPSTATNVAATHVATTTSVSTGVDKQIEDAGFKPIKYDEVLRLFKDDVNYQNNVYLFVDAREENQYKEGHVPLAWRVDHVKPKETINAEPLKFLLPSAEKIILYCHGGNCEDSLFVAGDLRDAGVDPGKIYVYVGGFNEWEAKRQPIEKGERQSGNIVNGGAQ